VKTVWPHIYASKNNSLNNGKFPGVGVTPIEHSFHDGVRSSAYEAYTESYTGSNLRVIAHVRVNKILFSGTTVTGVELVFLNTSYVANSTTCRVYSSTVISSAGVFGTPKLLKLSGIGPAAELASFDIPVVVDSPDVGEYLDDQFGLTMDALGTLPLIDYAVYGLAFFNAEDNPFGLDNFGLDFAVITYEGENFANMDVFIGYTQSRGTVKLASKNPDVIPIINPNYLSTASDKETLAIALNKTIHLTGLLGLTIVPDPCATADCSTLLNQLNAYLADFANPGYHWTGTAGLGRVIDPETMGVYGTTGLYVLDASALPATPDQNTQHSVYALSERGVELVILDHLAKSQWE